MTALAIPGQYLTFHLKQQCYGVPIGHVREINRFTEITPVPQTPSFVAGVMNLRGKVIPVVDLRVKFGLEIAKQTKNTCIIVIDSDSGHVGMIVDFVSGVIDLTSEQIEPTPEVGDAKKLRHVTGMAKVNATVLILIDIALALSAEELTETYTIQNSA